MIKNRILICTLVALSSGFFGSYIFGQITLTLHSQRCQNQTWALKQLCNTWATTNAMWQGSTTGLWMSTVLGAFVAGLATQQNRN
ncbi:MAG: hypothetical protein RMX68_004200 [Aulosira sp. ZfuVER01]|nr:hypothetical protein [Aulosira sp. ZfuVER01]MDZ7999999.1 hypothetical protein [Aulosira sp. DedVER01a]MDZ8051438.1 hypothetical protein [Aulosira sp. ZfuCHP01]